MQRLKVLALALMAVFAFTAVATATASAETELPEFTVESKSTGTSGKGTLSIGTTKISCEKGSSTTSPTSKKLGTGTLTFTSCKLGGEECKSLGGTAGTIVISGAGAEYHLVVALPLIEIWILIPSSHIECKFASTLITVKGNVLGKITPINTKTTKFALAIKAPEGKQELTKFTNDEGKEVTASLLASLNGGEFKAAAEESEANEFTTEKETEITHTKG